MQDVNHLFEMGFKALFLHIAVFFSVQTDSIHQQQKGKKTNASDQLAAESKSASVGQNMGQLPLKSSHLEALKDKTTTQDSKHNSNSNCHILRY